jgi:hypothetical protein
MWDNYLQQPRIGLSQCEDRCITTYNGSMNINKLKAGDWVEVRGKEEILRTLDGRGRFEELPFMPEMFAFCGRRLRVFKRAHKTCDTVNDYKGRKLKNTVHLDECRCDGQFHGGCQASCLIFWKEAWLKKVADIEKTLQVSLDNRSSRLNGNLRAVGCTDADVLAATEVSNDGVAVGRVYACQATLLPSFTERLPWWNLRQYLEDYASRNVGLGRMLRGLLYMAYNGLVNTKTGLGEFLRWLYDITAKCRLGFPYPRRQGNIPLGGRTPTTRLDLQPGELVRVKTYKEILATLDPSNKNRGLYFDAEMVPYCGKVYRVLKRVTRIIDEKTGKIQEFKNPCIILDGVVCEARYSECRLFCPRSIYSYWREIWLERVSKTPDISGPEIHKFLELRGP